MRGAARRTTTWIWSKPYDIWVVQTGKVTWRAYGDIKFTGMSGDEVNRHVSTTGRSESVAVRNWGRKAESLMNW